MTNLKCRSKCLHSVQHTEIAAMGITSSKHCCCVFLIIHPCDLGTSQNSYSEKKYHLPLKFLYNINEC